VAIERLAQQPPEGKPLFSIMPFVVISILSTLIVLGIMVLVHEFGHFAMAKLFRVKVEVFSIGFGKRLFGFRRGDTDYRLSLLPLGGYVKMQGELGGDGTVPLETTVLSGTAATGDAPRDSGDLNAKPRWQRVLIALAGPVLPVEAGGHRLCDAKFPGSQRGPEGRRSHRALRFAQQSDLGRCVGADRGESGPEGSGYGAA
jgi:hypothetical protein